MYRVHVGVTKTVRDLSCLNKQEQHDTAMQNRVLHTRTKTHAFIDKDAPKSSVRGNCKQTYIYKSTKMQYVEEKVRLTCSRSFFNGSFL